MPAQTLLVAPLSAIFIGLYGDNSTVLSRITAVSTGPQVVKESLPEVFAPGLQTTIQNGLHEVSFNATFYCDDATVIALSRGLSSFLNGDPNSPPEFNTYQVLLLHPDDQSQASWYFPRLRVIHDTSLNYAKNQVTEIALQFIWQDRNRYNSIFYRGNYDYLKTVMGAVSPI